MRGSLVSYTTTLYGMLIRLERKTALIKLSSGDVMELFLPEEDEELRMRLQRRCMDEIGMECEVFRDRHGNIISIHIQKLIPYRKISPAEILKRLQDLAGKDWMDKDIDEMVTRLRGRD